eukprot:COSAG05_NODE_12280_length_474_cov_1.357333_1_plen_74_part_10
MLCTAARADFMLPPFSFCPPPHRHQTVRVGTVWDHSDVKVAVSTCEHEPFTCEDECKGIKHEQSEVPLTSYDVG